MKMITVGFTAVALMISASAWASPGSRACLNMEDLQKKLEELPDSALTRNQVTDIQIAGDTVSDWYQYDTLKAYFIASTISAAQAKKQSGPVYQDGCNKVTFTNPSGEKNSYRITAFTERSLELVPEIGNEPRKMRIAFLQDENGQEFVQDQFEIEYAQFRGCRDGRRVTEKHIVTVTTNSHWGMSLAREEHVSAELLAKISRSLLTGPVDVCNQ
ncbi:MAG TPA: hypothetical protein VJB59_06460 [Bdellovibrionota bacterium]|nr:hypothetical protein [Bdellovibrionota bacterium]